MSWKAFSFWLWNTAAALQFSSPHFYTSSFAFSKNRNKFSRAGLKRPTDAPQCDTSCRMFRVVRESLDDRSWHCLWLSKFPPFARSSMLCMLFIHRFRKSTSTDRKLFDWLLRIHMFPVVTLLRLTPSKLFEMKFNAQNMYLPVFVFKKCIRTILRKLCSRDEGEDNFAIPTVLIQEKLK